jgi:hypothetical protein
VRGGDGAADAGAFDGAGGAVVMKEGCSFLKKRTKKLLRIGAAVLQASRFNNQKFFASFFQKRSSFFSVLCVA